MHRSGQILRLRVSATLRIHGARTKTMRRPTNFGGIRFALCKCMNSQPYDLPAFDSDGRLNVVVESPRGSRVKFVYKAEAHVFLAERVLGLGLAYPYDWGFICGTCAEDGDPVDVLVVDPIATYPGVLIKCLPIALLEMTQVLDGREQANSRRHRGSVLERCRSHTVVRLRQNTARTVLPSCGIADGQAR